MERCQLCGTAGTPRGRVCYECSSPNGWLDADSEGKATLLSPREIYASAAKSRNQEGQPAGRESSSESPSRGGGSSQTGAGSGSGIDRRTVLGAGGLAAAGIGGYMLLGDDGDDDSSTDSNDEQPTKLQIDTDTAEAKFTDFDFKRVDATLDDDVFDLVETGLESLSDEQFATTIESLSFEAIEAFLGDIVDSVEGIESIEDVTIVPIDPETGSELETRLMASGDGAATLKRNVLGADSRARSNGFRRPVLADAPDCDEGLLTDKIATYEDLEASVLQLEEQMFARDIRRLPDLIDTLETEIEELDKEIEATRDEFREATGEQRTQVMVAQVSLRNGLGGFLVRRIEKNHDVNFDFREEGVDFVPPSVIDKETETLREELASARDLLEDFKDRRENTQRLAAEYDPATYGLEEAREDLDWWNDFATGISYVGTSIGAAMAVYTIAVSLPAQTIGAGVLTVGAEGGKFFAGEGVQATVNSLGTRFFIGETPAERQRKNEQLLETLRDWNPYEEQLTVVEDKIDEQEAGVNILESHLEDLTRETTQDRLETWKEAWAEYRAAVEEHQDLTNTIESLESEKAGLQSVLESAKATDAKRGTRQRIAGEISDICENCSGDAIASECSDHGFDDTIITTPMSATFISHLDEIPGDAVTIRYEFREVGASGWQETDGNTYTEPGTDSRLVTGLDPGTTYEVRGIAELSDGSTRTLPSKQFTTDGL